MDKIRTATMTNKMKANELRIGNLVHEIGIDYDAEGSKFIDRTDKEAIPVKDIDDMGINGQRANSVSTYIPFDRVECIPLTEEWLKKFGFDKKEYKDVNSMLGGSLEYYELNHFKVFIMDKGLMYGYGPFAFDMIKASSVHQLQNLYFALTGEELTVK